MKKSYRLFILSAFLFFPTMVKAAGSATISASNSVEVGSRVTATVTLNRTAAWNIKIISSGSTSGCSQSFADATSDGNNTTKTLSVTCKATSVGTIGFTVTGDITSQDGANSNVSLSKTVTVTPVREKSGDATLSSITVEDYEISPKFDKDTLEYKVDVPSTVNSIKISAKTNESHASVEGTGEFEITEGINTFNLVVTAEKGNQITYVVLVNVEDKNPINVEINNKKYTVIKNAKNLEKPELFEETKVTINGVEIPGFMNSIAKITLIGLKDENGKTFFAIYDESKNEYKIYNEIKSNSITLYITNFKEELPYIKTTIKINDLEVEAYKIKENSRFAIVYAMNLITGEYNYYSYDTKEGTYQVWNQEEIKNIEETSSKDAKTYMIASIIFGVGLFTSIIINISLLKKHKNPKKEVISNESIDKKEKEEENNEIEVVNEPQTDIEENIDNSSTEDEMYDLLQEKKKSKKKK